jgi:hypothetical protein
VGLVEDTPENHPQADIASRPGGVQQGKAFSDVVLNLVNVTDLFMNPHDERGGGFLGTPAIWRFWWALKPLLERLDQPARVDALKLAFWDSEELQGHASRS